MAWDAVWTFLKDAFVQTLGQAITWVLLVLISIIIENKFGIVQRVIKLWHKMFNSRAMFKLHVVYATSLSFDNAKHGLTDYFKTKYSHIKVHKSTPQLMELTVDNRFNITLDKLPGDEISVTTSKISTGMRGIKEDVKEILDAFEFMSKRFQSSDDETLKFHEKEITGYFYLPYKDRAIKLYPPKDYKVKDYDVRFNCDAEEYASLVTLNMESVQLSTKSSRKIEEIIGRIL